MSNRRTITSSTLVAILIALVFSLTAAAAADLAGHWEGAIELPGTELGIRVDLQHGEDGWDGTIDIPMQGATGLPLAAITVDGTSISFVIANVPGEPTFAGTVNEDGSITGPFTQSGQRFAFRLGREATATLPRRPQTPEAPFGYRVEELSYANGDVTLAATLTIPAGEGPFPAVLLVTGSGAQNRDEEIFGHRPFAVIADHLTRHGIAVLRADDRGVGGSTGSTADSTTEDFAEDTLAGVRTLAARGDIDPRRIGLLGHSEGGIVAPLAAGRSDEVAFVILMAGTGVPLDEVMVEQTEIISRVEGGMTPADVEKQRALQGELLRRIKADADPTQVAEAMQALVAFQVGRLPEAQRPTADHLEAVTTRELKGMTSRWARFALAFDPRQALREVTVPVLVLNGSKDLQVSARQNVPEIVAALLDGGNQDVTVRVLPGLNHLFQPAVTGGVGEYATIETTVSPDVLDLLGSWIEARAPAPTRAP